jgi:hypothetical protein
MKDFFAGLRLMLAHSDLERMGLGTIMHQFIREEVLPKIRKDFEAARTDNEQDRLGNLIEEYEKYSDPRTPESKIYSNTAASIVRQLALRSRMDYAEMEDLMQQLAVDFYVSLPSQAVHRKQQHDPHYQAPAKAPGGNTLADYIRTTDYMGGPLNLNKMWMTNVQNRTQWRIREIQRRHRERTYDKKENEDGDGEELDPIAQVESPSHIDESQIREAIRDLVNYIHSKVRNPLLVDMFNLWFELAQEKGANKVDMKNDVYVQLREHGHAESDSMMNSKWFDLRRIIVSFFEKELGDEYVPRIKKVLHLSVAESLTHKMYRRRLAAWMLGGIFRGIVFAKE